ncbi:Uncharacterised protein [Actinobacillus pleuropneumoniae]|jgi:hypothetical protein|nr:Uncharacterised protein [Actinobacillus pleuropneumoniae]
MYGLSLDLKGLKGLRVLKVFQDHKAFLDLKDLLVLKAYLGPSDLRVLRAFQGRQDRLGPWVRLELPVLRDLRADLPRLPLYAARIRKSSRLLPSLAVKVAQ